MGIKGNEWFNVEKVAKEIEDFFTFPNCQKKDIHETIIKIINQWKGKEWNDIIHYLNKIKDKLMYPYQMVEEKVLDRLLRILSDHPNDWKYLTVKE